MRIRTLARLAENLRQKHAETNSWRKTAKACHVLTKDGRQDPGLAQRIAEQGYDPRRAETRLRLRLPPACITCGQKVRRVRHVPARLEQAVENLRQLEAAANVPPDENRVYARGGRRVRAIN